MAMPSDQVGNLSRADEAVLLRVLGRIKTLLKEVDHSLQEGEQLRFDWEQIHSAYWSKRKLLGPLVTRELVSVYEKAGWEVDLKEGEYLVLTKKSS